MTNNNNKREFNLKATEECRKAYFEFREVQRSKGIRTSSPISFVAGWNAAKESNAKL